jgi:HEAT repeat protein
MLHTLFALLKRWANDRKLVREVVRALLTLLFRAEGLRPLVGVRHDCVSALLHLALSTDERTQLWAASGVHMISRAADECAQTVLECDGIPVLLELLKGPFPRDVRAQAAQALNEIGLLSEDAAMQIDSAGGSLLLSDTMQELYRDFRTMPFF